MASNPLQPDPQTAALIAAARGNASGVPAPTPDQMPTASAGAGTPQSGGGMDFLGTLQQLFQMPQISQPLSSMEEQRQRLSGIENQYANMPIPQTGPHNLLLRILAGTRPGAAISDAVYSPGVERYKAQRQQLADQIAALKGQTGISEDELSKSGQLAGTSAMAGYRQGELALGSERNKIAAQKAQTYAESVQNKLQTAMRGLDLNALRTGSTLELNKSRIALNAVLQQVLPDRVDVEKYGIDTGSLTRQAVADLEAQMGLEKEHPLLNMLDQTLGTKLMPSAPQTPAGAQPVRGAKPLPPKTSKPTSSPVKPSGQKVLVEGVDF